MITILEKPDEIAAAENAARERLKQSGLPAEWARTGSVFEDEYLKIDRFAVRFDSGALGTYLRMKPGRLYAGGVAIVARHGDKIALVRQFRFASQREHLEIPRGFLARSEDLQAGATRELLEETGSTAIDAQYLGAVWPDSGLLSWQVHVFAAQVTAIGSVSNDEISEVCAMPIHDIDRAIGDGAIDDGITLAALALARSRGVLSDIATAVPRAY